MKPLNIGGLSISLHETDAEVTRVVNMLNDMHDSGKLKGLFVTYSTDETVGAAVVGDWFHRPMLGLLASAMAEGMAESTVEGILGARRSLHEEDDDDDDTDD